MDDEYLKPQEDGSHLTVPKRETYAYWAGLGASLGAIATSIANAVAFMLLRNPLYAICLGLFVGLIFAICVPMFCYPRNLKQED